MGAYKTRYGYDRWPADLPDVAIGLLVGKKWKEYRDVGLPVRGGGFDKFEFHEPWRALLDSAKAMLSHEYFRVSEWTEQHFHDWVMYDKLIVWGCASSSKALLPDEPVCFPDRVGTVGEVAPGDMILSATGRPTKVVRVAQQLDRPLYRVKFSDGSETVCADSHLWTVRYWGRVGYTGPRGARKSVYGFVTRVRSAEHLAGLSPGALKRRRMAVPLTAPVEFAPVDTPLDPYVLGCLLGDGSFTTDRSPIRLSSADAQLRDEFSRRLPPGCVLKRVADCAADYMVIPSSCESPVMSALAGFGLVGCHSWEKFVPDVYKVNAVSVRMDLLAGLLDTDGTVSSKGEVSFTTTSERLAADVRWLFESIGGSVTLRPRQPRYTYKGERRQGRVAYTLFVHGLPLSVKRRLFKLDRKRERLHEVRTLVGYKSLVSVEPVEDRSAYSRATRCLTLADADVDGNAVDGLFPVGHFTVTHNSNDMGLLMVLDWLVDPMDTVTLLGSTSKVDLKSRSWEAIVRYHNALKICNRGLIDIPGKISKQGQSLVNIEDDDIAKSAGEKAGIQGRALNEDGRLQGAHAKYVRLVVDELAEISNHDAIKVAMANLRVGTKSFKFIGLANPESWENPSCQYCIPPGGIDSVTPDTGSWTSTLGYFVRHHDGLKSPCVKDPSLRAEFPFLVSKEEVETTLLEAGGNEDAPQYWKMVRGFPMPSGQSVPTVLDTRVAVQNHVGDPAPPFDPSTYVATVAGIDPAWSEGGDGAYRARVFIRHDSFGKLYLDFTNGLQRLPIHASDPRPPVQQMRDEVIKAMRLPYEAPFHNTAIDASANQGLADDLMIYAGADCLGVNSSVRASDQPIRAGDTRPARDTIHDRGAEAWCILAEFCKAGMVKGLPAEALRALTTRRFAVRRGRGGSSMSVNFPLRLEPKDEFKRRFKHSPDECDACALAALAAKERFGLAPFGFLQQLPKPAAFERPRPAGPAVRLPSDEDYGARPEDVDGVFF